jgi:hypothetical protein
MTGRYVLSADVPGCGSSLRDSILVNIGADVSQISIGSNAPVCVNSSLALSAPSVAGANYFWSGPNGYTSLSTNPIRPVAVRQDSGVYTLTISTPGCVSHQFQHLAAVNAPELLQATNTGPVCIGGSVQLVASSPLTNNFSWSGPLGLSSTQATVTLNNGIVPMSGVYTVSGVIPGCGTVQTLTYMAVNEPADSLNVGSNTPLCTGQTLMLTARSYQNAQYTWTGPMGRTSDMRDGIFTRIDTTYRGFYTLTAVVPACGVYRDTTDFVVVNHIQSLNPVATSPVCAGDPIYLTALHISGASYLWTGPNGYSSTVLSPGIPLSTPAMSGRYSITANVPGCGTLYDVVDVIVYPDIRGVQSGTNSPVCAGSSIVLTAQSVPSANYLWSGPNGFTAASASALVSSVGTLDAGIYTLRVTNPACPTQFNYSSVQVGVAQIPNVGSNSPVCTNNLLALSAESLPMMTYTWTSPRGLTFSGREWTFSARLNDAGVYTLTSQILGCGTTTNSLTVVVNPPMQQNQSVWSNTPVCAGNNILLSIPYYSYASYNWAGPNGFTSNSNTPIISSSSEINTGQYSVTMTVPGCGSAEYIGKVVVNRLPVLSLSSNTPVCQGDAIYLNATSPTPLFTLVWTGPNGYSATGASQGISGALPSMSGVYSATSNVPGCGSTSASTSVQVNQSIQAVQAWTNAPLCSGQMLVLSATVVPGASYLWQGPGGFSANTSQVIRNNVNSSMAGSYTLYVSQTGCGGAKILMLSVNISSVIAPTATVVNSPTCVGNAVFLNSSTVSGATSYRWSGPNGYVSNNQNASLNNVQMSRNGVYTLTVTHPSCGVFSATVGLIVNPVVNNYNIVSSSPGCIGSTLSLSATIPTGGTATHLWRAPNGTTFNTPGFTIVNAQVADAGTYTYTINSPSCGTNTRTFRYVINDPSLVTATNNGPICRGASASFNATGVTGTTYSWSGPAGFASTSQFATRTNVQLSHAGVYTLNANVPGCGVTTRTTTLVVNSCRTAENSSTDGFTDATGFENSEIDQVVNKENQERLSNLKVYPNPFHEELSLTWSEMKVFSVKLFDLNGKLLYEAEPGQDGVEFTVRITDLPNGVYLLTVQTSAGPMSYRVTRL